MLFTEHFAMFLNADMPTMNHSSGSKYRSLIFCQNTVIIEHSSKHHLRKVQEKIWKSKTKLVDGKRRLLSRFACNFHDD